MQPDPAVERDRLLDREPGEIVAERDAGRLRREHSRGQAFLEPADRFPRERLEQPELGALRHDRDGVEQRPRLAVQARSAGEHRIPDGVGYRRGARGERLDDEERIAGRLGVDLVGIDPVRCGELRDRRLRQRRELEAPHCAVRRQLAEHDPKRMAAIELVVAEGGDDQHRQVLDPAGE